MTGIKFLLFAILVIAGLSVRANDTLTRAQIFNFNVGDTFDYKTHYTASTNPPFQNVWDTIQFSRCLIADIHYSADSDTLYIIRQWLFPLTWGSDTLILDSLQYPEESTAQLQAIDSSSIYNGRVGNTLYVNCNFDLTCYGFTDYVAGLGPTFTVYNGQSGGSEIDSIYLIYYAKGAEHWGTPYYTANQSYLVHYTPIPEECASWISESCAREFVKISTGNRAWFNGHTYVEMLYSYDMGNGNASQDSLIGFFRNDTLNRKVYFYNSLNNTPFFYYDFSIPAGGPATSLSQVTVGGELRTFWNEDCYSGGYLGYNGGSPGGYIEGVGGASGLITVYPCVTNSRIPQDYTFQLCNNLTCFSVCGQVRYPYDSTANCNFPLAIHDISPTLVQLKIFPNPSTDYISVKIDVANRGGEKLRLTITTVMGQTAYIGLFSIDTNAQNIDVSKLAPGIYTINVQGNEGTFATGRFVRQ